MKSKLLTGIFISLLLFAVFSTSTFAAGWMFIDLKPYANAKITNTQWWTGQPGSSDLEEALKIAKDGHEFEIGGEKVPFKIEDANLRIFGTNAPQNPKEITGIKTNSEFRIPNSEFRIPNSELVAFIPS